MSCIYVYIDENTHQVCIKEKLFSKAKRKKTFTKKMYTESESEIPADLNHGRHS